MSDNDDVVSMNMIFTSLYSFEAKHDQLSYLNSDYKDCTKTIENIEIN